MVFLVCQNCGGEFKAKPRNHRKFCSMKCFGEWATNHRKKLTCDGCGKEFVGENKGNRKKRFCSRECYFKWWTGRKLKGTCPACGKEFEKRTARSRFCSNECYQNYSNAHRTSKSRTCQNCGMVFEVRSDAEGKFCSRKCYYEYKHAHKTIRIRTCQTCGKEFEFKKWVNEKQRTKGKYCSQECFWNRPKKYPPIPKEIVPCPVCGREFERSSRKKKYCSMECSLNGRFPNRPKNPSTCKQILLTHHEEMKYDDQRLTTEFLAKLVGCECPRLKKLDPKELKVLGGVA